QPPNAVLDAADAFLRADPNVNAQTIARTADSISWEFINGFLSVLDVMTLVPPASATAHASLPLAAPVRSSTFAETTGASCNQALSMEYFGRFSTSEADLIADLLEANGWQVTRAITDSVSTLSFTDLRKHKLIAIQSIGGLIPGKGIWIGTNEEATLSAMLS